MTYKTEILYVLLRSLQAAHRASNLAVGAVNDFEDYVKISNALLRMIDRTERSIEEATK